MTFIENSNLENKKVVLRCDLNVTIKEGRIVDTTKIRESLKTINYLLEKNCSIIILSHLGKIKSEEDKMKNSLKLVHTELEHLLDQKIYFSKESRGEQLNYLAKNLKQKEILLVENTRYEDYPEKLESKCNEELSKYWASLGDVFVNDAFGTTHRLHASNYGISKHLETYYGYLIKKELDGLEPVINPIRPFTVVMGGAKVEDKIQIIKNLLADCDHLIVGGGIANTFLKALGYEIGKSLYDDVYLEEIKNIFDTNKDKIIIPTKVKVLNNDSILTKNINEVEKEDNILDIVLTDDYKELLRRSKTVFVNGTLGLYEKEEFKEGTADMLKTLANIEAKVIIGGGDALASVNKLANKNDYYFISTGGGATLEYIKEKKLIALEGE